jgi:hypothetical protein
MANAKGLVPWKPTGPYITLTEQVIDTVDHLKDEWPLSQRQWLYRLMARHGWEKLWETYSPASAEKFKAKSAKAKKLGLAKPKPKSDGGGLQRILNLSRRSGLIPWEAVNSTRGMSQIVSIYDSAYEMAYTAIWRVRHMHIDRQLGQERTLRIWVEAAGLVSTVSSVAEKYALTIVSGQGFDTIDAKYQFAKAVSQGDRPVTVLHIGDRDNSGETIHESLGADVLSHIEELGGEVIFERIAVTDQQIDEYGLAWVPPPEEDDGSNHGGSAKVKRFAQAEAFEPAELRELLEEAIVSRMDMDMYNEQLAVEEEMQELAKAALSPALEDLE